MSLPQQTLPPCSRTLKPPRRRTLFSLRRNRLKRHTKIVAEIKGFWNLLAPLRAAGKAGPDRLCCDTYKQLNLCCSKAFTPTDDWELAEAQIGAEEDWQNDRAEGGPNGYGVDFDGFFHAVFELIDLWSYGTHAWEYIDCLDTVIYTIMRNGKDPPAEFKGLHEISFISDNSHLAKSGSFSTSAMLAMTPHDLQNLYNSIPEKANA